MTAIPSEDLIPLYEGGGEDPQDRVNILPEATDRWLVLTLNGRKWLGKCNAVQPTQADTFSSAFKFQATPKGAYSALVLVRDVIASLYPDVRQHIQLFRA